MNVQHSLHLQYHDWGALEQGNKPPTAPRAPQYKWLPPLLRVCVHGVCVCVHFGWANAEHQFWVWVTILGRMSLHFIYHTTVSSGPLIWLDMWCFQESPLFNFFLKLNTVSLTTHDATSNLAVHTKHDATPQRDRLNQISQPIKSVCGRALSRSALHSQQNV